MCKTDGRIWENLLFELIGADDTFIYIMKWSVDSNIQKRGYLEKKKKIKSEPQFDGDYDENEGNDDDNTEELQFSDVKRVTQKNH